jgi:arginase
LPLVTVVRFIGEAKVGTEGHPDGPGIAATVDHVLSRFRDNRLDGFWIHLDADVLDDALMPAVDSRQPGGLTHLELVELLTRLLDSGLALGLDVTIYDPSLDPGRQAAGVLASALRTALAAIATTARGSATLKP